MLFYTEINLYKYSLGHESSHWISFKRPIPKQLDFDLLSCKVSIFNQMQSLIARKHARPKLQSRKNTGCGNKMLIQLGFNSCTQE